MALSPSAEARLRCPICHARLGSQGTELACSGPAAHRHPVVDGVPVLLNEASSIFSARDFVSKASTTFRLNPTPRQKVMDGLLAAMPSLNGSPRTRPNYIRFRDETVKGAGAVKVLVIGGSIVGQGMDDVLADPRLEFVSTDVSFGPLTSLICDAHDIPFEDDSFDGVIAQAVLEHVLDPQRCIEEIHRVLKPGGTLYAETPFMQQVHMGAYDFTRFTHSGHRRLFRRFAEIESGPVNGPGMALAWAYQYFLLSFTTSRVLRGMLRAFASLTAFPLKYLDGYLMRKRGAIDAASGFYFLGRKSDVTLSDRDVISYYRGALARSDGT